MKDKYSGVDYQAEIRKMKYKTNNEITQEYKDFASDPDMAPMLERFFAHVFVDSDLDNNFDYDFVEYMYSIIEYYNNVGQANSGNNTTQTAYPYTNENLKELFRNIDVKGKRVLTVGSSADQALNSVLHGASEVDLIDANIFTPFMLNIKIAAIRNLSREEFSHFSSNIPQNLSKYYAKFSHDLEPKYQNFFDSIILYGFAEKLDKFIGFTFCSSLREENSIFYTNDKDYYDLQEKLRNNDCKINFIFSALEDFATNTSGKYDLILLSNIVDYYSLRRPNKLRPLKDFFYSVEKLYTNRLNDNGLIQLTSRDWSAEGTTEMKPVYDFINEMGAIPIVIENSGMNHQETYNFPSLMMKKVSESESQV